jgi:hypothetical protein
VQEALYQKRQADPDVKAMMFTCSDERGGQGDDAHAKRVAEYIKKHTALRCIVVTGNTDGDESASDTLMSFKEDDNDVIILKNMGRVGFDCPKAKVLCDLSDVRAQGKTVQTWLRISTPYKDIAAVIIHPNDPKASSHYRAAIGSHMDRLRYAKSRVLETGEKEVIFKDRSMEVGDLVDSIMRDNMGAEITTEQSRLVSAYKQRFPKQTKYMERETLPVQWRDFVAPYVEKGGKLDVTDPEPTPRDPGDEVQQLRAMITKGSQGSVSFTDEYMRAYYGGRTRHGYEAEGLDMKAWQRVRKLAIQESKRAAGLRPDEELDNISSVDAWRDMRDWWVSEIRRLQRDPIHAR